MVSMLAVVVAVGLGAFYLASGDRPGPSRAGKKDAEAQASPTQTAPIAVDYNTRRQRVFYRTTHPIGSIVVSRSQRFLYLVQPNQVAIRYAIGVGPECASIAGLFFVTEKLSWPTSGQDSGSASSQSGLGALFGPRALLFGDSRAVHGTPEPQQVGGMASVGCFGSLQQDIVDLFDRVPLNERVVILAN